MKFAYLLVIVVALISIKYNKAQQRFMSACNPLIDQEIYFTGVCSVRFPFTLLGKIADLINTVPDSQTLDTFLRNTAFKGIGQFFRDTYSKPLAPDECVLVPEGSNDDFTPYLDALQAEGLNFADRLLVPGCLTTIWVGQVSDPFYDSGFSEIRYKVSDPFYCQYPDWQPCGISTEIGFCANTRDLFKVTYLYEITNRTIDNLLRTYANTIYFNYTLPSHLAGKNAFDQLLTKINLIGTGGTFMGEVKAFTNSDFFEGIRGWYLNETLSTTRKTTTTTTTTTTTRLPLTTEALPVSDVVVYLIPSLVALLGIIATVATIGIIYSFRPVVIHVQTQPIVNASGGFVPAKQEGIQMKEIPTTKV